MKKSITLGKVSWDMIVFLSVTMAGLGITLKNLASSGLTGHRTIAVDSTEEVSTVERAGILDLGCLDGGDLLSQKNIKGSTVRLRGRLCNLSRTQIRTLGGMKVKNRSNGVEGMVFFHGNEGEFVSELINLNAGKNVVELEWKLSNVARTQKVVAEVIEKDF